MLDVPVDAIYTWLGLATASFVVFATALALPGGTVPSAAAAAEAVDAVSVSPAGSSATYDVSGHALRLGPSRIALRSHDGTAHASFAYGPVAPSRPGTELSRVLAGAPPAAVFVDRPSFVAAIDRARDRRPTWREAVERLAIRRVSWGEHDVTIVG